MDMLLIIGAMGSALCGGGFVLHKLGVVQNDSWTYDLANLFGASFLVFYAYSIASWPFVVVEGIWALVALYATLERLASQLKNR